MNVLPRPLVPPMPSPDCGVRVMREIPVVCDVVCVHHSRSQQSQVQVVPAVDGKILDADEIDTVGLLRSVGLKGRLGEFRRDNTLLLGYGQFKLGGK